MRISKKGITLVELIICCAIIVMLGGACSAVIASGSKNFNRSTQTASSQMDADVLQTFLIGTIPSATNPKILDASEDPNSKDTGTFLFFDDETGRFTIRINGKNTTIRSIKGFTCSIVKAGDNNSTSARAMFEYSATLSDGSILNGGYIMSNTAFDLELTENPISVDLSNSEIGAISFNTSD